MSIFESCKEGLTGICDFLIFLIGYDGLIQVAHTTAQVGFALIVLKLYLVLAKGSNKTNSKIIDSIDTAINTYDKLS